MGVPRLTIAIPYHGDRWRFVARTIQNIKNDPRVGEIVIVDDHSDPDHRRLLLDGINAVRPECPFEIRLYFNDKNLFVFRNKRAAVEKAICPWVCLLDSDNIIDSSYLSAWQDHLVKPERASNAADFVYLPEWARPEFDYRSFAGQTFTRHNVARFMNQPRFDCMLNTCNFVVCRDTFLRAMGPENQYEPKTADSMWINYRLLGAGAKLFVVPGMQYEHTVHDQSTWRLHHAGEGDREAARIVALLKSMR